MNLIENSYQSFQENRVKNKKLLIVQRLTYKNILGCDETSNAYISHHYAERVKSFLKVIFIISTFLVHYIKILRGFER